jgi:hypothetical protein
MTVRRVRAWWDDEDGWIVEAYDADGRVLDWSQAADWPIDLDDYEPDEWRRLRAALEMAFLDAEVEVDVPIVDTGTSTVYTAWVDYDPDIEPGPELVVLSGPTDGAQDRIEFQVSLGEIPPGAAEADWPRADERYRGMWALLDHADAALGDAGYIRTEDWAETGRGYVAAVERA